MDLQSFIKTLLEYADSLNSVYLILAFIILIVIKMIYSFFRAGSTKRFIKRQFANLDIGSEVSEILEQKTEEIKKKVEEAQINTVLNVEKRIKESISSSLDDMRKQTIQAISDSLSAMQIVLLDSQKEQLRLALNKGISVKAGIPDENIQEFEDRIIAIINSGNEALETDIINILYGNVETEETNEEKEVGMDEGRETLILDNQDVVEDTGSQDNGSGNQIEEGSIDKEIKS